MNRFSAVLFILMPLYSTFNVLEIRDLFHKAIQEEEIAKRLDKILSEFQLQTPIKLGFQGANKMILAKHAFSPSLKYSYFMTGKELLEEAIRKDSQNIELHYLRYTIQLSTPSFLGYKKNIGNDREFLLDRIKTEVDKDLKNRIITFLVLKGNLNDSERRKLQ
jgi:hypothetical protein